MLFNDFALSLMAFINFDICFLIYYSYPIHQQNIIKHVNKFEKKIIKKNNFYINFTKYFMMYIINVIMYKNIFIISNFILKKYMLQYEKLHKFINC